MNNANPVAVTLQQVSSSDSFIELLVTFTNRSKSSYWLDNKLAFHEGHYTLDCLRLMVDGQAVSRKIRMKVKASEFPNDYLRILAGETVSQRIELKKYFIIPEGKSLTVKYQCNNLNAKTKAVEVLASEPLTIIL